MFTQEGFFSQMDLAIEIYFSEWLNSHPTIFISMLESGRFDDRSLPDNRFNGFLLSYRKLYELFLTDKTQHGEPKSHLLDSMIKNRIEILQNIMEIHDRSENRLETMRYRLEKEKRLFIREFNKLKGSNYGIY
jgi:hypothetical protein